MLESGWLGLVKLSPWRLAAVSCALWAFWWFVEAGLLPPIDSAWITYGVPACALLTGMLAVFSALEWLVKLAHRGIKQRATRITARMAYEEQKQEFREYYPYLTDVEQAILGYLVSKGQKTITLNIHGDQANTLISRGFIRRMVVPGQNVATFAVPHQVAPAVWDILVNEADIPTDFFKRFDSPPWQNRPFW